MLQSCGRGRIAGDNDELGALANQETRYAFGETPHLFERARAIGHMRLIRHVDKGLFGQSRRRARSTDSPPTPESKTPMRPFGSIMLVLPWTSMQLAGGRRKGSKQIACAFLMRQPLWMPLYRQTKRMLRDFHSLSQTVWCPRGYAQHRRDCPQTLMVVAIHTERLAIQDAAKDRVRRHRYIMSRHRRFLARSIVPNCAVWIRLQILVQRATERHIHDLAAAAYAQERPAGFYRQVNQAELQFVASRVDLTKGPSLAP